MTFLYIPATGLSLHFIWLWVRRWRTQRFLVRTWGRAGAGMIDA